MQSPLKYIFLLLVFNTLVQTTFSQNDVTELFEIVNQNKRDVEHVDALNELCSKISPKNQKQAERFCLQAEELAEEIHFQEGLSMALVNLGNLHAQYLDRHDKAINYYEQAYQVNLDLFEKRLIKENSFRSFMVNIVLQQYNSLINKSSLSRRERKAADRYKQLQGEFTEYFAALAYNTEIQLENKEEVLDSTLSQLEEKKEAIEQLDSIERALEKKVRQTRQNLRRKQIQGQVLAKENMALFDTIVNRDFAQDILLDTLQERELRLKDQKLKVLEKQNQVMEQQAKLNRLERVKAEQQTYIFSFGIASVFIVAILLLITLNNKKLKTLNTDLRQQKNALAEKNEEVNLQKEEILNQRDNILHQKKQIEKQHSNIVKKNKEIEVQSQILEKQNVKITSSITYAKKIQSALLLNEKRLKQYLPDSFIFFRPRDIVSGDFYWFTSVGNKLVIAAIDCTGHGVPGAFMSMIGNTILQQIVNNRGITAPNIILNELHRLIDQALRQKETMNQDGMDIALCTIDKRKGIIEFAGAKNPFIYMQNGEMNYIRGDRYSIGGYDINEPIRLFKKHTIKILSSHKAPENVSNFPTEQEIQHIPTTFYLFSDGYQDQIGGPKKRKILGENFRKYLHQIHHLPMEEQKEKLAQRIDKWIEQGTHAQLDDILVMGIRI